jgi:pimeloyl-ACP methyl ester carboxylesterase
MSRFDGDFESAYAEFIRSQFLPDTDPTVIDEATKGLPAAQPEDALAMIEHYFQWAREDFAETLKDMEIPIYRINSDRSPTDVEGIRAHAKGFDVVTMSETSHFPMIDDPETFNQHLKNTIQNVSN